MNGALSWLGRGALGALLAVAACGNSSSDDGGGGKAGTSGSGGSAGMGTGGGAGTGGGSSCCPDVAPAQGDACSGCDGTSCTYVDCAVGTTTASCAAGAWTVGSEPCSGFDCGGTQCAPGQICIEKMGGALLYECADNPCGAGPLSCECAAAACPGMCVGVTGTTVSCNTCTSGICP